MLNNVFKNIAATGAAVTTLFGATSSYNSSTPSITTQKLSYEQPSYGHDKIVANKEETYMSNVNYISRDELNKTVTDIDSHNQSLKQVSDNMINLTNMMFKMSKDVNDSIKSFSDSINTSINNLHSDIKIQNSKIDTLQNDVKTQNTKIDAFATSKQLYLGVVIIVATIALTSFCAVLYINHISPQKAEAISKGATEGAIDATTKYIDKKL